MHDYIVTVLFHPLVYCLMLWNYRKDTPILITLMTVSLIIKDLYSNTFEHMFESIYIGSKLI